MADAEQVVDSITPQPGVAYTALWLNEKGFERALRPRRLTNHRHDPAVHLGKIS